MNVHQVLIIEDNLSFAIKIERHLKEWGHEVIGIMDNSEDVFNSIYINIPTLILMDINIKGTLNGVDIAEKIQKFSVPVIFITGRRDVATFEAAKEAKGIQYLVKPFDMLTLKAAIEFSPQREIVVEKQENFLFVRKGKEMVRVGVEQIDWIKSDGNYCDLCVGDKRYSIKISMRKLLEESKLKDFLRIHKSYAVHKNKIEGVFLSENQLRVGGELLPLGRHYREEILRIINL